MSKFHITKDGIPALCKATKQSCPLGQHYDTEQEAMTSSQNKMSREFGWIPEVVKDNQDSINMQYNKQLNLIKVGNFANRLEEESERTKLARLAFKKIGTNEAKVSLNNILNGIHEPDEGATFSMNSNLEATVPTTGFCASPYPQYSKVFNSSKEVTARQLRDYEDTLMQTEVSILKDEDTYIGLWNDPETGKVYLDISKRYHTAEEARQACEQHDQIAYFDLQLFESVDVDRNATSGQ